MLLMRGTVIADDKSEESESDGPPGLASSSPEAPEINIDDDDSEDSECGVLIEQILADLRAQVAVRTMPTAMIGQCRQCRSDNNTIDLARRIAYRPASFDLPLPPPAHHGRAYIDVTPHLRNTIAAPRGKGKTGNNYGKQGSRRRNHYGKNGKKGKRGKHPDVD